MTAAALEAGQPVTVRLPGRRSFHATILRVRLDGVDVIDPRNGGLRTVPADCVSRRRTRKRAA
jgi:hypothetical protein